MNKMSNNRKHNQPLHTFGWNLLKLKLDLFHSLHRSIQILVDCPANSMKSFVPNICNNWVKTFLKSINFKSDWKKVNIEFCIVYRKNIPDLNKYCDCCVKKTHPCQAVRWCIRYGYVRRKECVFFTQLSQYNAKAKKNYHLWSMPLFITHT